MSGKSRKKRRRPSAASRKGTGKGGARVRQKRPTTPQRGKGRKESRAVSRTRRPAFFRRVSALGRRMATGFCRLYHACGRLFRRARAGIFLLWLTGSLCLLLAATVSVGVVDVTETYVLTPEAAVAQADEQSFDCILVLGAGLRDDGSPSHMLYDRVLTAVELYGALSDGTADSAKSAESPASATPLVMSGDHTGDYNEPAVMKQTAVDLGVPSEVIFLDHEGYSTYESIWRVREIFGAGRVLIVTQEYHLYRALYIARTLGLDAYGVSADKRAYRKQTYREVREMLARYKDFFAAARESAAGSAK